MKKIIGLILTVLFLYVGFCGIEVRTSNKTYKIPPFISNFFKSDEGKKAVKAAGEELKTLKDTAVDAVKEISEEAEN